MRAFFTAILLLGGGVAGCALAAVAGRDLGTPDEAAAMVGGGIMGLTLLLLVLMVGRVIAMVVKARSY